MGAHYMCNPPYELIGHSSRTCHLDSSSETGAAWSGSPECAQGVHVCSHVKCNMANHSVHHQIRLAVAHGNCSKPNGLWTSGSECDEEYGNRHYCAYDVAH